MAERSRVAPTRFFADLPEADLAAVASVAFEIEVASGQALPTGESRALVVCIKSGTADVAIGDTTVATIGPGDVVGETAVLASSLDPFAPPEAAEVGQRTASLVATSPIRTHLTVQAQRRDVWALDHGAPVAAQRLRAKLEEHRVANAERAR
jgi:CRP-like cAMP-binding protein